MFINRFFRENGKVKTDMDSNLGTCRPIYTWDWDCGEDQEQAELITRHFNKRLKEFKTEIAENACSYLSPYQISQLKKELRDWDSKKEMWK